MTLKEKLLELTEEDGLNIPLRTLAIYCGVSQPTLSLYLKDKRNISTELQLQIEKGLREYAQLVKEIVDG